MKIVLVWVVAFFGVAEPLATDEVPTARVVQGTTIMPPGTTKDVCLEEAPPLLALWKAGLPYTWIEAPSWVCVEMRVPMKVPGSDA